MNVFIPILLEKIEVLPAAFLGSAVDNTSI